MFIDILDILHLVVLQWLVYEMMIDILDILHLVVLQWLLVSNRK